MLVMYCSFIIFIIQNHFIRNILHELAPNSRFGGYFDFVPVAFSLVGGKGACHSQQKHI